MKSKSKSLLLKFTLLVTLIAGIALSVNTNIYDTKSEYGSSVNLDVLKTASAQIEFPGHCSNCNYYRCHTKDQSCRPGNMISFRPCCAPNLPACQSC